jgi:hypothetical protein
MSGECDKCGEHTLQCICQPLCRRQENGWINCKDKKPNLGINNKYLFFNGKKK